MKNAIKASEIIRNSWDWHGNSTQEFIINGKKIKTNLMSSSEPYWNGCDVPEKYTGRMGGIHYQAKHTRAEELDACIAEGYDEIRFMLYASKMIRGYCEIYVFASKSAVAKEMRKKLRAEAEAKKIEQAKAELSKNLSSQLKADAEKKAEREAQAQAEAIQRGAIINPEKKYHVISWKIGAPVDEKTDCGIWDGSGMAHFSEGFGGFTYSADGWLYFAQEAEDEITAEPDQETAQEGNSEAQKANSWHVSVFFSKNEIVDELQKLKDDLGSGDVVGCTKIHEHQRNRFIKALDVALFLINATDELPESSSDNSKEIIKETAEESTESNSKPHSQPVHHLNGAPRLFNDSSDDQLASLKEKRKQLAIKQHHILERYGNNQESQSIFKEITKIDSQIKKIEFKNGAVVRIVDLDSSFYGEWGIIEKFDGSFYYLAMHGDHDHAPMIIKEEQIELAYGKEA